jgi:hypothetical protein
MSSTPFEIIDAVSGQLGHDHGYYRILANSTIKYLQFPSSHPRFPDIRGEYLDFKTVPAGDWNIGYLAQEADTGKFILESVGITTFEGIQDTWHTLFIDFLALGYPLSGELEGELQCRGCMYSAVYHDPHGKHNVVVSFERYPEDIYGVKHETEIYRLIHGQNVGTKFLAHVTENGHRTIGYVTEHIAGGRHATIEDLEACREVLSKLHSLGIAHGSLSPASFIVAEHVVVHGFGGSYQTDDQTVLDAEMASLEGVLRDGMHEDEPVSKELSDQLSQSSRETKGYIPLSLIKLSVRVISLSPKLNTRSCS